MKLRKYTEQQLKAAVKESYSFAQTLKSLNIVPCGGNYLVLKKAISHFNLDTSHFTFQLWNKGRKIGARKPIEKYLNNEIPISSHKLKKRLINEKIFIPECSNCKLMKWLGKPIPLELDHINGNPSDNRLKNLRLLCPNCHALTPTYRGKNKTSNLARYCQIKGFTEFDSIHTEDFASDAQTSKSCASTYSATPALGKD